MPDIPVSKLSRALKTGTRLMGFDVGTKTIGLAISDRTLTVATPLETVHRKKWKTDKLKLLTLFEEHSVGGFIVGLPLSMDGSDSARTQGVRAFAENLTELADLPLAFWDERWSTAAVERTLLEADSSRSKRAKVIDKMAAAYILQGALHTL